MDYLDFVKDNYIWFIVGGIVLIMTLIGYFAEKTNFGKKGEHRNKTEKKSKKDKNESIEEIPFEEETLDLFQTDDAITNDVMNDDTKIEESAIEDSIVEEPMQDLNEIEIQEPMSIPNESIDDTISNTETEEIPEELYVGLDGEPNTYKNMEETIEDKTEHDSIDMDLPDIESLNTNQEEANLADDDIWRF